MKYARLLGSCTQTSENTNISRVLGFCYDEKKKKKQKKEEACLARSEDRPSRELGSWRNPCNSLCTLFQSPFERTLPRDKKNKKKPPVTESVSVEGWLLSRLAAGVKGLFRALQLITKQKVKSVAAER